jgi:hypothetical protein
VASASDLRGAAVPVAPRTLGKYTLIEQIGEGGMAQIFLARSRGIGGFEKLVVVKQMLPRLADDAELVARFLQEARLTATLDHPNIASVHEVGEGAGGVYYAMEYVRGRDLLRVVRRATQLGRPLQFDEVVAIVASLCAGLHHAHTCVGSDGRPLGIVHRDVSPANVLISFEGAVKLADFGVAKVRSAQVATEAGTLRGKIAYMSPEQCRGEVLDRRSDVYAVGVLAWELVAGRRMRTGDNEIALVRRIAEEDAPSLAAVRPDVPAALERIVMRALHRDPAQRYASAHAVQLDLEQLAHDARMAIGPRTIAAMMQTLFAADIARASEADDTEPTRPAGGAMRDPEPTPATNTLAPPQVRAAADDVRVPSRRWWPPALLAGIAGAAIAGAVMFARPGAAETVEVTTPDPPTSVEPSVAAPPPDRVVTPAPAPVEVAREAAPEPAVEATPTPTKRSEPKRRSHARKNKRTAAPQPIDLDAPLPPGGSE